MSGSSVKISKFLSLALRHQPARIGLVLDSAGWVGVSELLAACCQNGVNLSLERLKEVVRDNDKQRFSFSPDGLWIRANQGHSVEVNLGYTPTPPPNLLYHGTAERFLASIMEHGLIAGRRHHVHLSLEKETARAVGRRYGKPVVLEVASAEMSAAGYQFYVSDNGVWLADCVPAKYLQRLPVSANGAI